MKKVLIIVDMQNDFIDGVLGTKEAKNIVENVIKKIQDFDGDIYVTKDTHYENYLDIQEGLKLPIKHCIKKTEGWNLNNKIQNVLSDKKYIEFIKETFGSLSLAEYIPLNTKEVEIVGVCTDICVISNALLLKAVIPEAKIIVDASCCAGVTPESHINALNAMKMCQIEIINE